MRFTWSESGETTAITGNEAQQIIERTNAEQMRDPKSDSVYFHYIDDGEQYEAWYADDVTLNKWMEYVQLKDPTFDHFIIWRAGGLNQDIIDWIKKNEEYIGMLDKQ